MIKCVAIYPGEINEKYIQKVKDVVKLASKYHFDEIFTSIHLPEYSLQQQLDTCGLISQQAKEYSLELTVDIGGYFIGQLLSDPIKLNDFKQMRADFIRLDYGYKKEEVKALYESLNIRGFVINASIYNKKEVDDNLNFFRSLDENIEIRACHNYYVRQESGIDDVYALKQDSYFEEYNMPIYYCVPTYSHPRGPLHLGLCTLEKHRFKSIDEVITDLYLNHNLNALMIADEWLNEKEFQEVEDTLNLLQEPFDKTQQIDVIFNPTTTKEEKNIVLKDHVFRYDSPYQFLRSQSSRQMAEFASVIKQNNTLERKAGDITIDNELYKRYSGELQVVTQDSLADERVNVVAKLADRKDLIKLLRFREGITYHFNEVAK